MLTSADVRLAGEAEDLQHHAWLGVVSCLCVHVRAGPCCPMQSCRGSKTSATGRSGRGERHLEIAIRSRKRWRRRAESNRRWRFCSPDWPRMAHFVTFCDPKSLLLTTPVYACLQPFCPLWPVATPRFRVTKRGFGDSWGHLGRHQGRQDGGAWSHLERILPAARAPLARPACPPIQHPGGQKPGEH